MGSTSITRIHRLTLSLILFVILATLAIPAARAQAEGAATAREGAAIRPGDIIRLRIWREPDLSGEFFVDVHGVVVLPRIGPLRVTDDSPERLKERLVGDYSRYLAHPSIDVTVVRQVQVLGAVRNPGLYSAEPTMSVSDVLALAGGITAEGKRNQVRLVRHGNVIIGKVVGRTTVGDLAIQSGDQLYVPERSWFSRNPGAVTAVLTTAVGVVLSILLTR